MKKWKIFLKKFAKQENINFIDFEFYYNGNIIDNESTIIKLTNNKNARNIDIYIKK